MKNAGIFTIEPYSTISIDILDLTHAILQSNLCRSMRYDEARTESARDHKDLCPAGELPLDLMYDVPLKKY